MKFSVSEDKLSQKRKHRSKINTRKQAQFLPSQIAYVSGGDL